MAYADAVEKAVLADVADAAPAGQGVALQRYLAKLWLAPAPQRPAEGCGLVPVDPSAHRTAYQGDGRRDTARTTHTKPRESEVRTKQCGLEPKWLRKKPSPSL